MKKIAAISLVFIMLLSFCGCNSTKLTAKNLVGTWETELSLEDFAAMTNEDITELGDNEVPKELYEKIKKLKIKFTTVYYDDNTSDTKLKKTEIEKFINDEINILLDYYKTEGFLKLYQDQGVAISTNEELNALLAEAGTSIDELISEMKKEIEKTFNENELVKEWGIPDKKGYYVLNEKPEKFSVSEGAITLITDEGEEEITYCELTNKDTLTVSKIYYDYEEYNVNITFKRVK